MKTKISFFVINHTAVGGVERVNSRLISLFKNNGLNVYSVISFANENERNKIINFDIALKFKSIRKNNLVKDLCNYIEKNSITHLIFQGDNMSISKNILNAVAQTKCKAYLHYHGSPYAYLKKHLYWSDIKNKPLIIFKILFSKIVYPFKKNKLLKNVLNADNGFVTVSLGVQKELNFLFQTKFKNIHTIHNPFSFDFNSDEFTLKSKEKSIVFISRLERKHKNAFLSIKAWNLLFNEFPDWQFKILGNGSLLTIMKKYVASNKIKNVQFLGEVTNVDVHLEKSAISILTSDCEGFGMGLFESIAYKNALVSTKSDGGVIDLIEDNYNGFLVPKNNHVALSKKIRKLILDSNLRNKMGNNSYQKYLEFQNEDIFSQWIELLKIK